jgi:two-component system, chemotaxis family, response regulator Rcp1
MNEHLQVLLVEDNPADADLMREIFRNSPRPIELSVCSNGGEAMEYLHRQGRFASAAAPDLILLDLNLPGIDGHAVLNAIRHDLHFNRVPVTVLTSSGAEKDIDQSYELGANCYILKPLDFPTFEDIIRTLENFWFSVVKLPSRSGMARARNG